MPRFIFKHTVHDGDVDLTTVRSVSSPGRLTLSTEEVHVAGHRLAELSHLLPKGELMVIPDTEENQEGIAEHSITIYGDVGLPGRICSPG